MGLAACAGNPPDWWNPSGMYGNASGKQSVAEKTAHPAVVLQQKEEVPGEEDIAPAVDNYEEEKLAPLSTDQEEQTPAVSDDKEEAEELSLSKPSLLN